MNKCSFVLRIFNSSCFNKSNYLDILTCKHEFKTHTEIGRRYRI